MSLLRLILGPRLANRDLQQRRLSAVEAVPAMGLDGLASSAYGPEAALTVLMPLGAAGLVHIGPVMAPILALLVILYVSYCQTMRAYPTSGGAYTVTKENLGTNASLTAAAALMVDYVLNVAVAVAAGVAALTSALPRLHPYTLPLCLAILVVITMANLRGTLEASRLWAVPTYTFVARFLILIALGIFRTLASGGHPQPVVPPPPPPLATAAISLWLLLRAFASGCTAMTGVEAVSNGMSAFREPVVKEARRTLTAIVVLLGLLLAGIAHLAYSYHIYAMDQQQPGYQSVLSQLAGAVVGRGVFYSIAMASLLTVLCLSANTSFTDFPRLCRIVAQDRFLPAPFAIAGRRLVHTVGILYLAGTAGLLLIAFGGITDRLIPLFAIGAFMTFTLSQAGMVAHWRRELTGAPSGSGTRVKHHGRLLINAVGATATGVALLVIVIAKFAEGAWITLIVIPLVIVLQKWIHRYYRELRAHLREEGPIDLRCSEAPLVLVATEEWNRLTDDALRFAVCMSTEVLAVHLTALAGPDVSEQQDALAQQWRVDVEEPAKAAGVRPPRLISLEAQYRQLDIPLLQLVRDLESEYPQRHVAVLIPEVVKQHWWQYLLHTHRARRLRTTLMRYGGSRTVVITVPWYLEEPRIEEALMAADQPATGH